MEHDTGPRKALRVAFIGKNATSKYRAGRYLKTKHGFKYLALADVLRKIMNILYHYGRNEQISTPKRLLFYDAVQSTDPTIWIKHIERRLMYLPEDRDIIIPDARYVVEISRLRELGFIVVRIVTTKSGKAPNSTLVLSGNPGKLLLTEYYSAGKDIDQILGVEYSVVDDGNIESFRKGLDNLVMKLRR